MRLAGVEHCLHFSSLEDSDGAFRVFMRSYKINMMKSSDPKLPRAELEEIGPSLDLVLRRSHLASEDLTKTACTQVKNLHTKKKVKNVEEDAFGSKLGTVHVQAQDVSR